MAWRVFVFILSAWFARGACLCGGILTHLPLGLTCVVSLYQSGFSCEVCLSGEIFLFC